MNRAVRSAAITVFVIATLATGRAITDAMPNDVGTMSGSVDPFVVKARVGQRTQLRYATVEVGAVRAAKALTGTDNYDTSPGVLVLADLRVRAVDEPRVLGGLSVLSRDGRVFHADHRWPVGEIPTGLTWHITPVFEVPADALPGARLEVALGSDWWQQRRDHVLQVDLGIDRARGATMAGTRAIVPRPTSGLSAPRVAPVGQVSDE